MHLSAWFSLEDSRTFCHSQDEFGAVSRNTCVSKMNTYLNELTVFNAIIIIIRRNVCLFSWPTCLEINITTKIFVEEFRYAEFLCNIPCSFVCKDNY